MHASSERKLDNFIEEGLQELNEELKSVYGRMDDLIKQKMSSSDINTQAEIEDLFRKIENIKKQQSELQSNTTRTSDTRTSDARTSDARTSDEGEVGYAVFDGDEDLTIRSDDNTSVTSNHDDPEFEIDTSAVDIDDPAYSWMKGETPEWDGKTTEWSPGGDSDGGLDFSGGGNKPNPSGDGPLDGGSASRPSSTAVMDSPTTKTVSDTSVTDSTQFRTSGPDVQNSLANREANKLGPSKQGLDNLDDLVQDTIKKAKAKKVKREAALKQESLESSEVHKSEGKTKTKKTPSAEELRELAKKSSRSRSDGSSAHQVDFESVTVSRESKRVESSSSTHPERRRAPGTNHRVSNMPTVSPYMQLHVESYARIANQAYRHRHAESRVRPRRYPDPPGRGGGGKVDEVPIRYDKISELSFGKFDWEIDPLLSKFPPNLRDRKLLSKKIKDFFGEYEIFEWSLPIY